MPKLVIVESPTKAKTIGGFLPKDYVVKASMGHIRDLPAAASEIPAKVKGEPWARLGVNVEADFEPLYVIPDKKKKLVGELKEAVKKADEVILATDEDREGESIGWHLREVLQPKQQVRRMVFHEITREAIAAALANARDIDMDLVRAQETRRILDRLVGYTVSPLLWRKIAPRLSAGRVQSVAVRLLVLRERERRAFRAGQYWDLKALLNKRPDQPAHRFEATLVSVGDKRVATGRDFDEATGKIAAGRDVLLLNQQEAEALRDRLRAGRWTVSELEEKESTRAPYAPFTTSTLQQEANRKLGLSARETMRVAQELYENGYITYMRTDSVHLSDEAINGARRRIRQLYGEEYLSPTPRRYQTKTANAQEAHEAIRPAGDQMRTADELPLAGRERALYDLIWKRTIASQMANARLRTVTATIGVGDAVFKASGRTVLFAGFFRAYVEGSDDPDAALESQEQPLPLLAVGEAVDCRGLEAVGHETKPPARYTDATLVKALENEGIGRPSTYATIIDTIQERGYCFKLRKELVPTFTAFAVTVLMEDHFDELVDLKFTANMEQKLDDIAAGSIDSLAYLREFFLGDDGLENQVKTREADIEPRVASTVDLDDLHAEVRIGQYGPFVAKEENGERLTASLPRDLPPADLSDELVEQLLHGKLDGPRVLGQDAESGLPVLLKTGPFGPYVQLGEDAAGSKKKPKRASLLKGMMPDSVDLDLALALLNLPRTLGEHPETGKAVQAGVGRFGPFVVHDGLYANLKAGDDVLSIDMDRALELLADKASGAGRGRSGAGAAKSVLKDLGEHPDGGAVQVLSGRYGPYVNHGKLNVTLPKDAKPEAVTLEQALAWLAQKAAKKPAKARTSGGGGPAKRATPAAKSASSGSAAGKAKAKSKTAKSAAKGKPTSSARGAAAGGSTKSAPGAKSGAKTGAKTAPKSARSGADKSSSH